MTRVLVLLIGYAVGLFQTGFLISNFLLHDDIRQKGSGNSGATNAFRVFGAKVGLLVFAGDLLKALIYCLILKYAMAGVFGDKAELMMLYGGLGVVLGHCFPFYMGFKGGKGVASSTGMSLAYDPRITLLLVVIFVSVVAWKRFVSLGSLTVLALFPVVCLIFHAAGWHVILPSNMVESVILFLAFAALSFYLHRANLERLMNGTENKFQFHRGKEEK